MYSAGGSSLGGVYLLQTYPKGGSSLGSVYLLQTYPKGGISLGGVYYFKLTQQGEVVWEMPTLLQTYPTEGSSLGGACLLRTCPTAGRSLGGFYLLQTHLQRFQQHNYDPALMSQLCKVQQRPEDAGPCHWRVWQLDTEESVS